MCLWKKDNADDQGWFGSCSGGGVVVIIKEDEVEGVIDWKQRKMV